MATWYGLHINGTLEYIEKFETKPSIEDFARKREVVLYKNCSYEIIEIIPTTREAQENLWKFV